ncbi:protein GLE1 [Citrus sinensis]|uniref:Protein GLE1 n=1 Tax=Citrus sinensis TaxID=2711 RepID=A0ACB8LI54_CITSI|nr:protein GLE1 [Citrus sinensis]
MYRGAIKLELRCPQKVDGIAIDPEPDWSFDALLSELNSLETRLNASSKPVPFTKTKSREISTGKSVESNARAFVIRVSDDELENDNERKGEEVHNGSLVAVKRFTCDALYLSESDDSDDDVTLGGESYLMDEVGLADGALVELTHQHQLGVKEEIRNLISTLETQLISENEQSNSALAQVEKDRDMRREMDRKNDTVYQRKIAEALDNHLTAVQRDHELKSQIEERKIRSDAAYEEAKRKERALQEEKIRQEKVKAEAEMQAKLRAEEAKRAALEAEKRAAKEAAEREAAENSKRITAGVSQDGARGRQPDDSSVIAGAQSRGSRSDGTKKLQSADFSSSDVGSTVRATESALNIEQKRLQKLKELDEENQSLKLSSNEDFSGYEKDISRLIRQIRGLKDNVRTKASELVKIFNNPLCPQSISLATFSKKVVSRCETPDDNVAMSCGYVIVLVASQVPQVMDILLGEFHRACIYTVPKHIVYSEAAFESEEAYYKTIGYREEDGKIESLENYLSRLKSYMRLYAALIQTEIPGVQNAHGLKEGWAWLARFLNALPANIYTAVALNAFLQLAGFALFKKYKSQFRKILDNIYDNFLNALKAREDSKLNLVIAEIQYYIEDKKFLEEPEGRTLQAPPLSSTLVPEADYQEYGRYHQYQEYGYQYH